MKNDDESVPMAPAQDDDDDIEIIEVVGIDDDAPPIAAEDRDPVEIVQDEVDVVFDDDGSQYAALLDASEHPERADDRDDDADRERLLRLQAEFENLKKRVEKEKDEFFRYATSSLMGRLIPVLDNFERALGTGTAEADLAAFRDGVALIHKQLMDELRKQGLELVDALGEPFDPKCHEAVATASSDDHPPNTVIEEYQKGYYFLDRLLRPALVRVNVDSGDVADDIDDETEI